MNFLSFSGHEFKLGEPKSNL